MGFLGLKMVRKSDWAESANLSTVFPDHSVLGEQGPRARKSRKGKGKASDIDPIEDQPRITGPGTGAKTKT